MKIWSDAFKNGENIPVRFTCDGTDISPSLFWSDIPEGSRSLVLICDDPDAPGETWVHWVVFNIPPDEKGMAEDYSRNLPGNIHTIQGNNSWGRNGYGGPCPPGGEHRYYFKLYALDIMLDLNSKVIKKDILNAVRHHILAETEVMGKYSR